MSSPENPYIAGRALGDDPCFFGRDDILCLVESELRSHDRNCVVLYGQRRIGKTTILKQLEQRLHSDLLAIRFDLFEYTSKPLGRMLGGLASEIASRLKMAQPDPIAFDDEGQHFRRVFLPAVYKTLGGKRRLVLLFDEFDVLDLDLAQKLGETAGEQAFFNFLRHLMENEPRLGFVIVIGRKAEDLTMGARSAFRLGSYYKRVSVLDDESARKLVRLAERQGSLRLAPGVVERVLGLTANHPYLTQLLCRHLFDRTYDYSTPASGPPHVAPLARSTTPQVSVEDVDTAVAESLEAGNNVFAWIWDGLPPAERVVSAAIAAAAEKHPVVTKDQINEILKDHGIRILVRELDLAPETLVQWELLRETQGGYRFFVEILRRWIVQNRPIRRVKDDLDSTNHVAKLLYESGKGYFERGQWQDAENQLRQALRENPNHIKAHVLLGEALHRQGRLIEAEQQLANEALPRDREQARFPLVRVLNDRATQCWQGGELDGALDRYLRIVELSPAEQTAEEHTRALRIELGNRSLITGAYDRARDYFRAAGDLESERRSLEVHIDTLEKLEEYGRALDLIAELEHLPHSDEEQRRTAEAQDRCLQARALQRRYLDGKAAFEKGEHAAALADLIEVVLGKPNYQDTPSLRNTPSLIFGAASLLALSAGQVLPPVLKRKERQKLAGLFTIGVMLGGALATMLLLADARVALSRMQPAASGPPRSVVACAPPPPTETAVNRANPLGREPSYLTVSPKLGVSAGAQALPATPPAAAGESPMRAAPPPTTESVASTGTPSPATRPPDPHPKAADNEGPVSPPPPALKPPKPKPYKQPAENLAGKARPPML